MGLSDIFNRLVNQSKRFKFRPDMDRSQVRKILLDRGWRGTSAELNDSVTEIMTVLGKEKAKQEAEYLEANPGAGKAPDGVPTEAVANRLEQPKR